MDKNRDLQIRAMMAARDYGINSVLFRNALAKKLNLNLTESFCLTLLGIGRANTPKDLAKYTGLTSGSMTSLLDRLEKRNFIKRKANPDDRRGIIIEITDEYQKLAQSLVVNIQNSHNEVISSFSNEDLKVVSEFLERFAANMLENSEKV